MPMPLAAVRGQGAPAAFENHRQVVISSSASSLCWTGAMSDDRYSPVQRLSTDILRYTLLRRIAPPGEPCASLPRVPTPSAGSARARARRRGSVWPRSRKCVDIPTAAGCWDE